MSWIGQSAAQVIGVLVMVIILLAVIALMAAENIGGAGGWLSSTGTMITSNMPLIGLIVVAGLALGAMGAGRRR